MNGWVKLHLKTLDNEVWLHDPTAWRVFEYLLLKAYVGKPQGTVTTTRGQMAQALFINNDTLWSALLRLKKRQMVNSTSNNRFTTISICNWSSYQGISNNAVNNETTTKQQRNNTLSRLKSLDTRSLAKAKHSVDKRDPEITLMLETFESRVGKMPRSAHQVMAAAELLKSKGLQRTLGAIESVVASRGERYAPSIASLEDLRDNWIKLENFYARKINEPKEIRRA